MPATALTITFIENNKSLELVVHEWVSLHKDHISFVSEVLLEKEINKRF